MASLLITLAPLFPYDPALDEPRGHLHLILIYAVVWIVHLGYVGFIAWKWRLLIKERAVMAHAKRTGQ